MNATDTSMHTTTDSGLHIKLRLPRADFALEVDLRLPARGISVLFGPSGSGKTSLLRCVAGLDRATQALVRVGEQVWQDDAQGVFVPTWQRALGYVFQEPSLFAHLNVRHNLHYGLRRSGAEPAHAQAALEQATEVLGIGDLLERSCASLSGGERQRVALARALATRPALLLLDEPLSALDAARKEETLPWLERMRSELGLPMLYVTHSSEELTRLADHVVALDRGQVRASGSPAQVLAQMAVPITLGADTGALISGQVAERDTQWALCRVAFEGGSLWVRDNGLHVGQSVRLLVLARDVSLSLDESPHSSIQNHLPCTVHAVQPDSHPSQALVQLRVGTTLLHARITRRALHTLQLAPGSKAWAQVKTVALAR